MTLVYNITDKAKEQNYNASFAFIYIPKLKEKFRMKKNNKNAIVISVKVNGKKITSFTVHTDPVVNPGKIAGCFNNMQNCSDKKTYELVVHIKKNLAFETARQLLWQKGMMEQILSDALEIAPTSSIENEIVSMQIQLLPLIDRIYNPATNMLSESDRQSFKPYKSAEQVLSVLFGAGFIDMGIFTFSAKVVY